MFTDVRICFKILQFLLGFSPRLSGNTLPAMQEMWVLIPGSGRAPGGVNGNPLQYSCLGSPRGAWQATVHEVAKT